MAASQVLICSGIPGSPNLAVEGGKPYPETAIDIAKIIEARGMTVSFEDERAKRKYVEQKALDILLPILQVTTDVLTGISGGLFTLLIVDLLGLEKSRSSILHVEYRVADPHGNVEEFSATGIGTEVLEAIDKFEQRIRDQ